MVTVNDEQGFPGYYEFEVPAGDYIVAFERPDSLAFSPDSAGADPALDSDSDPLTGQTGVITIDPGENSLQIDQGFYPALSVGGFVWHEFTPGPASYDAASDSVLPGVVVNLLNSDSTAVLDPNGNPYSVVTGPDGSYIFIGLEPGDYIVQIAPSNFGVDQVLGPLTSAVGAVDPNTDVPGDDNGMEPDPTWGSLSQPITLEFSLEPDSTGAMGNFNQTLDLAFAAPGLPVELVSFTAIGRGLDGVELNWTTATERDNAGFSVEWSTDGESFTELGWVEGAGTTLDEQEYTFHVDGRIGVGRHTFRLRQLDFDGAFEYSEEVEVFVELPGKFLLEHAYPNPFSSRATIRFAVKKAEQIRVDMFDAVGRMVKRLYDDVPEAEKMIEVKVDGGGLASGMYLIRLASENFNAVKKVILAK